MFKTIYFKCALKQEDRISPSYTWKIVHETIAGLIDPERLKDVVIPGSFEMYTETANVGVNLDEAVDLILAAKANQGIGKAETHYRVHLDPSDPFSPLIQVYIDLDLSTEDKGKVLDWKTHHVDFEPTDNHQLAYIPGYYLKNTDTGRLKEFYDFFALKVKSTKEHTYTAEKWRKPADGLTTAVI